MVVTLPGVKKMRYTNNQFRKKVRRLILEMRGYTGYDSETEANLMELLMNNKTEIIKSGARLAESLGLMEVLPFETKFSRRHGMETVVVAVEPTFLAKMKAALRARVQANMEEEDRRGTMIPLKTAVFNWEDVGPYYNAEDGKAITGGPAGYKIIEMYGFG